MKTYRFDFTIESTIGRTVIVEGEDEFDALEKFYAHLHNETIINEIVNKI